MFETNLVSNNSSLEDSILGSWVGQAVHIGLEIESNGLGFRSWKVEPKRLGFLRLAHGHEITKEENTQMLCFTLHKTKHHKTKHVSRD